MSPDFFLESTESADNSTEMHAWDVGKDLLFFVIEEKVLFIKF